MDYIEAVNTNGWMFAVAAVGIIIAAIGLIQHKAWLMFTGFASSIVVAITFGLFIQPTMSDNTERSRIDAIGETYNINIDKTDFAKLSYPESKPTGDTVIYGSYDRGDVTESSQLTRVKTTLVWSEGELRLFEGSEEEVLGSELPRAE